MNENEARTLIERFAEKQQGGHFACPRCGKMAMDAESVTRNALSRRATVHICDVCGTVEALEDISRKMTGKNNVDVVNAETRLIPQIPPMIDTPRQAFFKEKKRIPWREAKGKIAAEALIPYPPGIPLVNPGELVTEEIWEYMEEYRKKGLHFHGPSDASLDSFCVL